MWYRYIMATYPFHNKKHLKNLVNLAVFFFSIKFGKLHNYILLNRCNILYNVSRSNNNIIWSGILFGAISTKIIFYQYTIIYTMCVYIYILCCRMLFLYSNDLLKLHFYSAAFYYHNIIRAGPWYWIGSQVYNYYNYSIIGLKVPPTYLSFWFAE